MGLRTGRALTLAITLIIGGATLCFAAYLGGADTSVRYGDIDIGVNGVSFGMRDYNNGEYIKETKELEAFDQLDIDLDSMDFEIKTGDRYKMDVIYYKDNQFSYKVKDGELVIEQDTDYHVFFGFNSKVGKLTLYIPEGKNLNEVEINAGIGETLIQNVTTKAFKIKGEVGEIVIENLVSYDTDVKIGVGEVKIQGDLKGKTSIKGGMGSLQLDLVGREEDYNYDIKKGLGDTTINNQHYEGFGNTRQNNGAANEISIKAGVGEIKVKTN